MSPAAWSLAALLLAIGASIVSRANVGIIAIALAWVVGVFIAGHQPEALVQGFPSALFLTLTGVTLLFAMAEANGTLNRLTSAALRLTRGPSRWLPVSFFVVAGLVSSAGPGAIASVALVAPVAMAMAIAAGISPFLAALMVANGANAGNLSAVSSIGIIANTKMAEAGLVGHELKVWLANFAAHLLVASAAYFAFGAWRLPNRSSQVVSTAEPLTRAQWITTSVLGAWIVGVPFSRSQLGCRRLRR